MGTWSHELFANDDAADFQAEVIAQAGWGLIAEAFADVLDSGEDFVEAGDVARALAAADVVAAGSGRPSPALPDDVAAWVAGAGPPAAALVRRASRVARLALDDSELKDLWGESPAASLWRAEVEELARRLAPPGR